MTRDEIDLLKKVNWFTDLPEDFFVALAGKVRKRVLDKDDVLFHKGDEGDAIFIINSGSVKIVTQDSQDNEVVLNRVGAGEVIGEMALLDLEPRSAGVVALEETSIMELGRDDFMEILSGQPDLALAVIRSLIARLRHNTSYIEQITEMSRHVARGDYSFIEEFHSMQEEKEKTGVQDKIGLLMAEFIAMVRGVREREENLKEQVQKLTLKIDEPQRQHEVAKITNTDFYASLKKQAQHLRAQRKDNK
jgi:CRP/FNR family transcriptional regulator, cyclic AMP receptor protein